MTQYKVTFHLSYDRIEMVCDKDAILDALNRLPEAQIDDIFMHILDWRIGNGDREDMEDLLYHVFSNFVNTASIEDIKKELISNEIEWIVERMYHDPQLTKDLAYWDIHVEVIR